MISFIEADYTQLRANRFCANFSKSVYDNIVNVECSRGMVRASLKDFFRNVLKEVATENGMTFGRIIRSPIDNLVKYHLELAPSQL